jgi:hypothetical protein
MDIETQLRESLAAHDPGAEFDAAVLSRLARPRTKPRRSWRVPAAIAATVLAVAFGLDWHLARQREARAGQQLLLALQITSYQLDQVQRRLVREDIQEKRP